jgi:hypothetical protein
MTIRQSLTVVLVLALGSALCPTGCAYRMAAPLVQRGPQHLRVVAQSPQQYHAIIQSENHPIGPDGRINFNFRMLHRGCSVYLLGPIPIHRLPAPDKEKLIILKAGERTLARLSVRDLSKLPEDADGYRLLRLRIE